MHIIHSNMDRNNCSNINNLVKDEKQIKGEQKMTLEKITNIMEDRIRILQTLAEYSPESLIHYQDEYAEFPTARHLLEPEYTNFMTYKIWKAYENTRKEYPELPDLGIESI